MIQKPLVGMILCALTVGAAASEPASELQKPHSIIMGNTVATGEFAEKNSFSPSEMLTIKFQRTDSSPLTSLNIFIADIDVTDYVLNHGTVHIGDGYIEVSLPEIQASVISEVTGQSDNIIVLTINGESYSTILSIDNTGENRRALPAIGALVAACAAGAATSAAVELVDIFTDTQWGWGWLPYPWYNGRDISFATISAERNRIATSTAKGCVFGSGLKLIKGSAYAATLTTKIQQYLLTKIPSVQSALSPILSKFKVDLLALTKKSFSAQVKEVPSLVKTFSTNLSKSLGLELFVYEAIQGAETYVQSVSPGVVTYGKLTTFTVTGNGLPSTLTLWIDNCKGTATTPAGGLYPNRGGSSTSISFTCTPSYNKRGNQRVVVADKPSGTSLFSSTITVK